MKAVASLMALIVFAFAVAFAYRAGDGLADAVRSDADSRTAGEALERDIRQAEHAQQMAEWRQTEATRVAAWRRFWTALSWAASLLVLAGSLAGGLLAVGWSRARVLRATAEAHHVRLDPETRQFPLLSREQGGRLLVVNPNNGQVLALDGERQPVPMMIAGSSATQLAGAIAKQAAKSNDPAGVAMVSPPVLVDGYGIEV